MNFVIKKSDTVDSNEQGISVFHDYQFPFHNASLGVSEIYKRYPQTGYDVDKKIDAYWYVEDGLADVFVGGKVHHIGKGDMIFIPKGEKFFIDTTYVKLVVCSTPSWSADQHEHIEN